MPDPFIEPLERVPDPVLPQLERAPRPVLQGLVRQQVNAPGVQDFSALSAKMDALRSGVQPMQGAAQVDDGWGAVDQSLNIAPKMPVLPPVEDYATRRARETRSAASEITQQQMLKAQANAQQQQAYRDQVRQYRASMPQGGVAGQSAPMFKRDGTPNWGQPIEQQNVDPYVPMWRQTEHLIGTPEERRARGWR